MMFFKVINIFKLIRIGNIIFAILTVLLSSFILSETQGLLNCIVIIALSMAFGNMFNDLLDINIDKIAHPKRPLATGVITRTETKLYLIILFILLLIVSTNLNYIALKCFYMLIFPLLICYSLLIKKIPLLGNVAVALLLSLVFIFTELILQETWHQLLVPACLAFGLSIIRELIKDIDDYIGDKKNKINTLPVCFGINYSNYFAVFLIIFFSILCLLPYYLQFYGFNYFIALIFLVEIPLYIVVFLLLNKPKETTYTKLTDLTKYMTFNGLIVLYIANL